MRKFMLGILLALPMLAAAETVTFPILGLETVSDEPIPVRLEWDEGWFGTVPPTEYNHALARIACVLAEVAYVDAPASPADNSLVEAYKRLGVRADDIDLHYDVDYDAPVMGNDQAAFSFACRKIRSGTLVFVTIRGTPANANEWISNVNVSDSTGTELTFHEGFYRAAEGVHKALIYYMLKHGIDPDSAYFLITGHSRGAAVSNMLGALLVDEGYFSGERMYVYTFAAPNVCTDDIVFSSKYDFIWNIVNAEDIVPTVPPNRRDWRFKKFGHTLTLVNYWNTDPATYEDDYVPRMNAYFSQFLGREYAPFKMGPFIPVQISRILSTMFKDVESYYNKNKRRSLRTIAEGLFLRLFPADSDDSVEEFDATETGVPADEPKSSAGLVARLQKSLNESAQDVIDYASLAFVDMHACEMYLSWMLALDETELFSDMESTEIVIDGTYQCAVFNERGEVMARVRDGVVQLSSVRAPIAAMPLLNGTVIGFPANARFKVLVYYDSLIPTPTPTQIEHYDAAGILYRTDERKSLYPHKAIAYSFDAGENSVGETEISAEKFRGKDMSTLLKFGGLKTETDFHFTGEVSMSIDGQLNGGLHFGNRMIYGSFLIADYVTKHRHSVQFNPGIGHQETLFSHAMLDLELYGKCVFALGDRRKGEARVAFVPSPRVSVSFKPVHKLQFFVAGVFDVHIDGFNNMAFRDDRRKQTLGKINLGSCADIQPSILFGVKF